MTLTSFGLKDTCGDLSYEELCYMHAKVLKDHPRSSYPMQMGLYKLDQDTKKLTQTKLVKVSCIPGHSKLSISDGVPTTIDNEEGPTSPTRFNSRSKVQALSLIHI